MSEQLDRITNDNCQNPPANYNDIKVLFVNCTLSRSPIPSNTEMLIQKAQKIYEAAGATTQIIRPVDYKVATGVDLDMSLTPEWDHDEWPTIQKELDQSDILVLCTPIWLGEKSSICNQVIERMYGYTHLLNKKGQYAWYDKVGATLITGNEDGLKHCAMNILFSLSHMGYTIPPQADAGWIGEVGPGLSYMEKGSGGPENDFTNRNTTFLVWNTLHLARMLKDHGGIAGFGNLPEQWKAGCDPSNKSPEHKK